jgi:AcrR family transcriptional regulator
MEQKQTASRGRPMAFDKDTALQSAMMLFWEKGYEGASLADLLSVMGINNKPSLYRTFGNKQTLFELALQKYLEGPVSFISQALSQPKIDQVFKHFFDSAAKVLTDKQQVKGCMVIQGALSCSEEACEVKALLSQKRHHYEKAIEQRIQQAVEEGELKSNTDSKLLAKFVSTVHQGMSVQATTGATEQELKQLGQLAIELIGLNKPGV